VEAKIVRIQLTKVELIRAELAGRGNQFAQGAIVKDSADGEDRSSRGQVNKLMMHWKEKDEKKWRSSCRNKKK
jgi:hypothetical protein